MKIPPHGKWLFLVASLLSACGGASSGTEEDLGQDRIAEELRSPTRWEAGRLEVRALFDPQQGQLPEGLALRDGSQYVGDAPTGQVMRVDPSGAVSLYSQLPPPVPGQGFLTGLRFGCDGALYAALVSFNPTVTPGIYRIPPGGGAPTLFAQHPRMVFPNGLDFDDEGTLWVADSTGVIFRVSPSGAATVWSDHPLLGGDQSACPGALSFPIGANGIVALRGGTLAVTNSDHGTLLTIPRNHGRAGTPVVIRGDCATLAGADGLVQDRDGSFIVATGRLDRIVRVTAQGNASVLSADPALDFPASLAVDATGSMGRVLYVTDLAFVSANTPGAAPRPGLLAIHSPR